MLSTQVLAELRRLWPHRHEPGEAGDRARWAFDGWFALESSVLEGCFGLTGEDVWADLERLPYGDVCMYPEWGLYMVREWDEALGELLLERSAQYSLLGTAYDFDDMDMARRCREEGDRLTMEILAYCAEQYAPFEIVTREES